MDAAFWQDCWANQKIGFHQEAINPNLLRYWPALDLAPDARVLVPLAGKSQDMRWLADAGQRVVGVELAARAAEAFFDEQALTVSRERRGAFDCFVGEQIEIWVGDVFDLAPGTLRRFDGFYDRAALIALPREMRQRYVDQVIGRLRRGATGLLISFAYDASRMDGPPFSIDDDEIGRLYGRYAHVDLLAEKRGLPKDSQLRRRGLTDAREGIYRLLRL